MRVAASIKPQQRQPFYHEFAWAYDRMVRQRLSGSLSSPRDRATPQQDPGQSCYSPGLGTTTGPRPIPSPAALRSRALTLF
jgi:hypothetical protein